MYRCIYYIYMSLIVLCLSGCNSINYIDNISRIKDKPLEVNETFRSAANKEPPAKAGAIWKNQGFANNLFTDQRAGMAGDVITIKIQEITSATEKATTDLGRTSGVQAGIPNFMGLETNKYPSSISPANMVKADSKNDFKGSGETTRNGMIVATMSARVVEALPNGNLAIEGAREVILNGEKKEMLVQGVVRQKDIAADNSVYSTQIADARVIITGLGILSEKQNPGWLSRVFDLVWPF